MVKGLNKVMLIGRVEGEPEVRQTPTGRSVATFSLATPRSWTSSEGEHHEETEWFNVVAWGNLADICEKHVRQNEQIYVEGRLQTRSWEDNQGRKHYRTEVVAHELIVLTETGGYYE
jgi:single-strand DNA-binding protein